jgi:hypothetical protein
MSFHKLCALGGLALAFAGCTDDRAPITGTQSLKIDLVSPTNPGDINNRLPDGAQVVELDVTALGPDGQTDTTYTHDVSVYVQYLGTLTPALGAMPLATWHVANGVATNQSVQLPPVFGQTTVWVSDDLDAHPTYATGTSPTLWFRDPTIADVQTPTSENAINALTSSPLQNKQVAVNGSRYGATGRLVVTSVFAQGYTVSDVNCSDAMGTPPCTTDSYNHIEVYSFSAPTDQNGNLLKQGQCIDGFDGGISEFDGLTEVGFPETQVSDPTVNLARLPPVNKLIGDTNPDGSSNSMSWFRDTIQFERNEAAPIEIDNAKVCPLDDDFTTFGQWKIDPQGQCNGGSDVINVITAGTISDVDPSTLVGMTLPRVVGVLRPVEIGNFDVWIIYPRGDSDLTLK